MEMNHTLCSELSGSKHEKKHNTNFNIIYKFHKTGTDPLDKYKYINNLNI